MGWWWSSSSGGDEGSGKDDKSKGKYAELATPEAGQNANTFDPARLPKTEKLPPKLQKLVDDANKDDSFFDDVVEG